MSDEHVPHPWIAERDKKRPHKIGENHLTFNEKLAVFLTEQFGTMWMFYALVVWNIGWPILAVMNFSFFKHDPYPFTFLLFLSNLVQLFALPILALGQQILSRASEKQAEQTFRDAEAILKLQDEVHRLIKINNRLTEEIHRSLVQRGHQ